MTEGAAEKFNDAPESDTRWVVLVDECLVAESYQMKTLNPTSHDSLIFLEWKYAAAACAMRADLSEKKIVNLNGIIYVEKSSSPLKEISSTLKKRQRTRT